MPNDTGYQRPKHIHFSGTTGVDVNTPVDKQKAPNKQARLMNMMPADDGALVPRTGLVVEGTPIAGSTPVHSIRRLNDTANALWAKVYGTGTSLACKLSTSPSSYSNIDSGYSGNPLVFVPWRPTESISPNLYVFDSSRTRKVSVTGVDKQIGLPPPADPPTANLSTFLYDFLNNFQNTGGWTNAEAAADGTASIAGAISTATRINTTITKILYDSGTTWACIVPAALANIGPYTHLRTDLGLGPDMIVTEVHRGSAATTIATPGITYDSGSTGLCTICPTEFPAELRQNAVVKLGTGGGAEYVRVLSITYGPSTAVSFRCSTVSTRSAGNALQVVDSFRAWAVSGAAADGSTIDQSVLTSTMGAAGGTGTITQTSGDSVTVFNPTGAVSDEDYIHISVYAGDLTKISSITLMWDLSTGDFKENYFYRTIEQNVLVATGRGTQTMTDAQRRLNERREIISTRIEAIKRTEYGPGSSGLGRTQDTGIGFNSGPSQRQPVEPIGTPSPTTPSNESGTGDNQWSEIRFRRGDCFRYGTDLSKGWLTVTKFRVEVKCASSSAGVIVRLGSMNVTGGGGPDVGQADGLPYQYRYRGRDSTTGVVSDYSPVTAERVLAYRNKVALTLTQHPSTECDMLDIERFGATQDSWLLLGSTANSATPTYTDDVTETAARANSERSDRRVAQPWVRYTRPYAGTATSVIGNVVIDNGSNALPASLIPGTPVLVNGIATRFRRFMNVARTKWEVDDCLGSLSSVAWECTRPAIYGQPLRSAWLSDTGVMFACDDTYLLWSEGNDPDATHERNRLEITNPSDPLVAGFSYNGRDGVFTTQQLLNIEGDPVSGYNVRAVPNGKGLISPWALAVQRGSRIAWVAMDGIYTSEGGEPVDITTESLRPLFPNDERAGADTSGIEAPVITLAEAPYIRLAWGTDSSLYFFYRDSTTARRCLRYDTRTSSWLPYEYAKPLGMVYAEEGEGVRSLIAGSADTPDGKVYTVGGSTDPTTDDGTGFAWLARSYSEDFGDRISRKRFGDVRVDVNPNGATIAATLGLDNHSSTVALGNITGSARGMSTFDLSTGDGTRARNISLELSGTTSSGTRPRLYGWEPSVLPQPEDTKRRAIEWQDAGFVNGKYMMGVYIEADTGGVQKTIRIEYDGGTLGATINVTHTGQRREYYAFTVPFNARLVRIATADDDEWTLYGWDWRKLDLHELEYSNLGHDGDKYMQGVLLDLDTLNVATSVRVEYDGAQVGHTHTITNNGRRSEWIAFTTPFVARLVRIVDAVTGVPIKVIAADWVFNRESPSVKVWETQYTSLDIDGWKHAFQYRLALACSDTVTLETYIDGGTLMSTHTIASTSGVKVLTAPLVLPARKFKLVKFRLTCASDFRMYVRDLVVQAKGWNDGDYRIVRPFGALDRDQGATV